MILFSIVCDLKAIVDSRCLQIKYVQFDTSYGNLSHIFTRKCQRGYSLDQNPAWVHPSEEKGRVNKPRLPLMPAEPGWDGRCRDPRWQSLTRHDCLLTHRYRLRFWHHHLDFASLTRKMKERMAWYMSIGWGLFLKSCWASKLRQFSPGGKKAWLHRENGICLNEPGHRMRLSDI